MKKTMLLLLGLTFTILVNGQTIKIQGGISISTIDWQNVYSQNDEKFKGYSVFAGLDYMDKKNFNLSSNIGLIRKGGKYYLDFPDSDSDIDFLEK